MTDVYDDGVDVRFAGGEEEYLDLDEVELTQPAPGSEEPVSLRTVDGMQVFVTKDSGKRAEFANGGVRDSQDGKPRFDLLTPETVPYEHQILTRWAHLMARGAEKYADRNWEQFSDRSALDRAKSSAFRHFMQWLNGERDEDHAVAVLFNIMAAEYVAGVLAGRWPAKEAEK